MSAKMTSQSHATDICRTVDEGAIFELSFIFRWHKPATAYALTPKMAEVADYTDGTFHKVIIRETGEILLTREFKRTFRDKYPRRKNILKKTGGVHKYDYSTGSSTLGTYKNEYFAIKYYMYQMTSGNIKLVMHLLNDNSSEVIFNCEMLYSADSWDQIESMLVWFKTLSPNLLYLYIK